MLHNVKLVICIISALFSILHDQLQYEMYSILCIIPLINDDISGIKASPVSLALLHLFSLKIKHSRC